MPSLEPERTIQNIGSCQDLTNPNTIYRLNQTIIATVDPCLDVKANNITIDCNGYTIFGNGKTSIRASNRNNITIINCTFVESKKAMHLENCTDVFISNININGSSGNETGIYAEYVRDGFLNNSIINRLKYGIRFRNTSDFVIMNSSFKSNEIGIFMEPGVTNISVLSNRFENNSNRLSYSGGSNTHSIPFPSVLSYVIFPVNATSLARFVELSVATAMPSYAPPATRPAIFVIKHNGSFILPNVSVNVTTNITEEASPIAGRITSLGIAPVKRKGMAYEKCKALFKLQNVSFEKKDLAPNEELKAKIEFAIPWTTVTKIPLIFKLYANNVKVKDFICPINVDVPDFMFDIVPSKDSFAICLLFNPAKLSCPSGAYEFELDLDKNHWTSVADHYGPIRTTKPVFIAYEFSIDPSMLKRIKAASLRLYCKGKIIKEKTVQLWR
ncbi:hypothetical protein DRJ16_04125 [Candidatus Woesearchaeota archaeon]|nr:MAG: hypothetical protein DRJ16_04125 [Candidatus Woesearchaeota archaeon]